MWILFDKKTENGKHIFDEMGEISQKEFEEFFSLFSFCAPYSVVKMMESIAIRNGVLFQEHMNFKNLLQYRSSDGYDVAIEIANQFAFNYASAVKSFVDITDATLKETRTDDQIELYDDFKKYFYDHCIEYRFWMRLRNFIVHRGFPYTIVNDSQAKGVQLICHKDHLLKFSGWNTVRQDLIQMNEHIELEKMVGGMNTCIKALRLVFVGLYTENITNAIKGYARFCREHSVKEPIFSNADSLDSFDPRNASFTPVPIGELQSAFSEIQKAPFVNIEIVK